MTIQIPDEIARLQRARPDRWGVAPEQLLIEALKVHFPPIPPELQEEFDAWELVSEEDEARFELNEGFPEALSSLPPPRTSE